MPDKTASHPTWSTPRESKTFSNTKLVRSRFDWWMQVERHNWHITVYSRSMHIVRATGGCKWRGTTGTSQCTVGVCTLCGRLVDASGEAQLAHQCTVGVCTLCGRLVDASGEAQLAHHSVRSEYAHSTGDLSPTNLFRVSSRVIWFSKRRFPLHPTTLYGWFSKRRFTRRSTT